MAIRKKSKTTSNKEQSFWSFWNCILLILFLIGLICGFMLLVRFLNRPSREKESSAIVVRPVEPKPATPPKTPTPEGPSPTPVARLIPSKEEREGEDDLVVPEEAPPYPDEITDKSERRNAIKRYIHTFSDFLINSKKVSAVYSYPSARYYILNAANGDAYYAKCRRIREAIEIYDWKPTSLLTYCKGGGLSKVKKNYNRQARMARRRKAERQDWMGVGLDDPDRI